MNTRTKIRSAAIALSLGYTVVRVLMVQATLAGYGVNPWVFMAIDAVCGVVYVLGIEQLIVAMRSAKSWQHALLWSLATAAAFAAPYMYLFLASRELPLAFGIGLGVVVALLLANAVLSFRRRVKQRLR